MKTKLQSPRTKLYVLACSYGPDSMFLLNALFQGGYKFVVAHVNYHKRKESNFEQESLRKYCLERNISFETKDVFPDEVSGNFQTWARNVRYQFFKEVYEKYNADATLLAHQQDDHLETYLIQNQRGGFYSYYGIQEKTTICGMNIIRPMLSLSKKEIIQFDDENNIPYAIDSSNLSDDYTRNQYRNHYLNQISEKERQDLLKQIKIKNNELSEKTKKAKTTLKNRDFLGQEEIKNIDIEDFAYLLFELMRKEDIFLPLSTNQIREFKKAALSSKSNIEIKLDDEVSYFQEYGEIRILKKQAPYEYKIEKPLLFKCDQFMIDLSSGGEDRNIHKEDYPLTIRCKKDNDKYLIKNYSASVNRLFIDWKMPLHLRGVWPLIVNKDDKIIYIPRYRKRFNDKHKTVFKISLK